MKRMMNTSLGVNVMDPQGYDSFEGSQVGQSLADALGFSSNVRQALGDAGWAGADQGAIMAALQQLMGREQGLREQETARDLANARIAEQMGVAKITGNRYAQGQKAAADRMAQSQRYQTDRQVGLEGIREKNAQSLRQQSIAAASADKRAQMEHTLQMLGMKQAHDREMERVKPLGEMEMASLVDAGVKEFTAQKQRPPNYLERVAIVSNIQNQYKQGLRQSAGQQLMGPQQPMGGAPQQPKGPSLLDFLRRPRPDQQDPLGTYGPMTY